MLAFDGALALIAIRCTGIAPNEGGRFLRELAAKLDPPTSRGDPSAAAAHRQR
jgi:hypothetical protein